MNPERARSQSLQLVENGYADWLADQVRNLALAKFENAPAGDHDQLARARIVYDLAAEVRQVIIGCSRHSKNT